MSQPGAASKSIPPLPPSASSPPEPRSRDLAFKKAIYAEAIKAGCRNVEASRRAGVTPTTGSKWGKQLRQGESELPSKTSLLDDLFKSYSEARPATKAVIAKRICDMLGWDAAKKADDSDRIAKAPLRDLVVAWVSERETHMHNQQRAQVASDGGGSPQANAVGGVRGDSPTATKISDSVMAANSADVAGTVSEAWK